MTENYQPVPPAPQQPEGYPQQAPGQFQGFPQPQYPQAAPAPYGQQPYTQQPYGQPQYGPYPPQAAPQWAPAAQPKRKSSGFRLAAGIVGIVLGFFLMMGSSAGFSANSIAGLLLLLAGLGNITTGIVLLAMQRGTTRGAPITSITFAGFALLAALLAIPFTGGAIIFVTVLLATPVLVVMGIGLSREMKEAAFQPSYTGT